MQIQLNGQPQNLSENLSVAQLLETLQLDPVRVAVEVNEELVPRRDFGNARLFEGDRIEVVTFVGGG